MSGTTPSFAWLLVGLILVPVAVVGADGVQRALDSETFPSAPLRAGERFVYDVTVMSDFHAVATTAAELIEVRAGSMEDGASGPSFTVKTSRGAAPWDVDTRNRWEQGKQLAEAHYKVDKLERVDLNEGQVVERADASAEHHWYRHGGDTYRYALEADAAGSPEGVAGTAIALAREAGIEWSHEVPVLGLDRPSSEAAHALPLAGTYQGLDVYGRSVTTTEEFRYGGARFGCETPAPPFSYLEEDTAAAHAHDAVRVVGTWTEWRAPDLALPVAIDCHRTYVSIDDGADLGHIRVVVTLAEHEAGGRAHDVAWDEEPAARLDGDMDAVPTFAPGVPADTPNGPDEVPPLGDEEVRLRFPLSAAHPLAEELVAAEAADFATPGDVPYVLVEATYWPGTEAPQPCAGLPDPVAEECGFVPGRLREPPRVFVEPHWYLTYENGHGDRLVVQVLRNMTTAGQTVEDMVKFVGDRHRSAQRPMLHLVPDEAVPVHIMFAKWLDDQGLAVDVWREQALARVEFALSFDPLDPDGADLLPVYRFRHGSAANVEGKAGTGAAEYVNERSTLCTYHAGHGALLEKRTARFLVEDGAVERPAPAPASFVLPGEAVYQPVAALVVGVVGLGAVALGATPGGRSWLRGLLALPLFTKMNKDQVMEHRTRDSMVSFVKSNPGVGTEEIRRHFGIGWGTAVYHLSALEQNGHLSSMRRGGNRHWFAAGAARGQDREAIALLRSPAARRLHDAIHQAPGRTQQELAAELGVTHGAVIFQVRKLERVGLVRKERDGRFVRYFASEPVERGVPTRAS